MTDLTNVSDDRWQMTDISHIDMSCGLRIKIKCFWKREKANENVDEISPYDPFVNLNGKVGAKAGTSRWTSDLVFMFLESAEPGEWE